MFSLTTYDQGRERAALCSGFGRGLIFPGIDLLFRASPLKVILEYDSNMKYFLNVLGRELSSIFRYV